MSIKFNLQKQKIGTNMTDNIREINIIMVFKNNDN